MNALRLGLLVFWITIAQNGVCRLTVLNEYGGDVTCAYRYDDGILVAEGHTLRFFDTKQVEKNHIYVGQWIQDMAFGHGKVYLLCHPNNDFQFSIVVIDTRTSNSRLLQTITCFASTDSKIDLLADQSGLVVSKFDGKHYVYPITANGIGSPKLDTQIKNQFLKKTPSDYRPIKPTISSLVVVKNGLFGIAANGYQIEVLSLKQRSKPNYTNTIYLNYQALDTQAGNNYIAILGDNNSLHLIPAELSSKLPEDVSINLGPEKVDNLATSGSCIIFFGENSSGIVEASDFHHLKILNIATQTTQTELTMKARLRPAFHGEITVDENGFDVLNLYNEYKLLASVPAGPFMKNCRILSTGSEVIAAFLDTASDASNSTILAFGYRGKKLIKDANYDGIRGDVDIAASGDIVYAAIQDLGVLVMKLLPEAK